MKKVEKITKAELQELQDALNNLNQMKLQIGDVELQKQEMIEMANQLTQVLIGVQGALKEKYGPISVGISDGKISYDELAA